MSNTKASIVENLQKALEMEMTAAHQYQLHAHVLKDWGLGKLAAQMRGEMEEELGHSDRFIERMMYLGAEPELKLQKPPKKAASLKAMFESDLADEEEAIAFYTEAAQDAASHGDIGSRTLFEQIVLDEEGHKGWLSLQIDLIDRLGEGVYAAKYMDMGEDGEE